MKKMNPVARLYLLVIVMSVFIVVIGLYGIRELKNINQNTQTLYADRVLPIEQLTAVQLAYTAGILSTAQQAKAGLLSFNEAAAQAGKAEKNIETNWNAYLLTRLTPEEAQLVQQTSALMKRSAGTIDRLKQVLAQGDANALDGLINKELYPAVNPIIAKLHQLTDLQVKVGEAIYKDSDEVYNNASKSFYLLIVLSLIFAIAISYYIVKSVKELIKNLQVSNSRTTELAEKYRSLVEHAGDPIFILNEHMALTEANSSACKLLGYTNDELLAMKITEVFDKAELAGRPLQWDALNKNKTLLSECIWRRKDGAKVNVELNIKLLEGKGYLAIVRDITERKRAEDAIRESERKYRNIFENVQDVFYQTALDGTVLDVSPSIQQHTGFTREELVNTNVSGTYFDPEDREKGIAILKEHGEVKDYELKLKSSTGEIIYALLNARIIADEHGLPNHIDGVFRNVTQRIQADREREKMIADIVHRNKKFEEFAHMVSHDLRAPVASILGLAEVLRSDISDEERVQMQAFLFQAVAQLDDIVKVLNQVLQAGTEMNESKEAIHFSAVADNNRNATA